MRMPKSLISLVLVAAQLATLPVSSPAAPPAALPLEGHYIIMHGDRPRGCKVVPKGDGTYFLLNEQGYAPATAKPVPGSASNFTVEGGGWGSDCSSFTVQARNNLINLRFSNGTEWTSVAIEVEELRKVVAALIPGSFLNSRIPGGVCYILPVKGRQGVYLLIGEQHSGEGLYEMDPRNPYKLHRLSGPHPASADVLITAAGRVEVIWGAADVWFRPT
jgi:hypothetical protein